MNKFEKKLSEYQIFLIGGANGVGTSWFAMELARHCNIRSVIGTDSIREIMREILPQKMNPGIFKSTFLNGRGDDYQALSKRRKKERIVSGYSEQVRLVEHGIDAIIKRSLEEGIRTIIEGIHLIPRDFVEHPFFSDYSDRILHISIDVEDCEVHRKRFFLREDFAPGRSKQKYLDNFQEIRWIREHLLRMTRLNPNVMRLVNHENTEKIMDKLKKGLFKIKSEKFQRFLCCFKTEHNRVHVKFYYDNSVLKKLVFKTNDINDFQDKNEVSDILEYSQSDHIAVKWLSKYFEGIKIHDDPEIVMYINDIIDNSDSYTEFQKDVYRALISIPAGQTETYTSIANRIGRPNSSRAVGTACKKNLFPILVPCHRVVGKNSVGGFAWGINIKKALLEHEREI